MLTGAVLQLSERPYAGTLCTPAGAAVSPREAIPPHSSVPAPLLSEAAAQGHNAWSMKTELGVPPKVSLGEAANVPVPIV